MCGWGEDWLLIKSHANGVWSRVQVHSKKEERWISFRRGPKKMWMINGVSPWKEEEKNLVLWIWSPPLTMTVPYCSLWEITSCCFALTLTFWLEFVPTFRVLLWWSKHARQYKSRIQKRTVKRETMGNYPDFQVDPSYRMIERAWFFFLVPNQILDIPTCVMLIIVEGPVFTL